MADTNIKATMCQISSTTKKVVKEKKSKPIIRSTTSNDDLFDEDEEDLTSAEAKGLLQNAFQVKNYSEDQDEQAQEDKNVENFEPVDQLMLSNIQKGHCHYEPPILIDEEEDSSDYIVIGCRLPNGVVISLDNTKILLRGKNDMPDTEELRHYKGVGFTKIARPAWKAFIKTHKDWPPLLNGSVFIANGKDLRWDYL